MTPCPPARHLRLAGWMLAVCLALVFSPLLLDLGAMNKYVVALGLIGVFTALSLGLNALIDLLLRRR